ncbi:MAG TPA: nucleotide exchange factor GrpE [Terriglobales bacterium]
MPKGNGKTNVEGEVFDVEHELPAADAQDATTGQPVSEGSVEAEAQDELSKLKAENAAYLDRLARLQAEFDNFRKRNAREQQEFREYALADSLKQFLPILDSLDRAAKTPANTPEDVQKGIELIDRQFHDVLSRLGVEPVRAEGEFDPNLHQAIQMVETSDVEDNHIVDELQRGYRLRDRLLRPAMVRVAQNNGK